VAFDEDDQSLLNDEQQARDENGQAVAEPVAREPKYYRLKRHLLTMTQSSPPGTPVPPERTLAEEFDTSRTTVRQALAELVVEGRLERIQGKGTFVAKPKVAQSLQLTSYTEDMRAQGLEPASRLLEVGYVSADDDLADLLRIREGARVLRIERLRLANGEPMAIEATHLSAKRFPGLRRHLTKYSSLYSALSAEYGAARHRHRAADAAALPALDRRGQRAGGVGALDLPRGPLQVPRPADEAGVRVRARALAPRTVVDGVTA
jgi:GntR family transcriptional regulator